MGIARAWFAEYRRIFTDTGVVLIFFGAVVLYSFFYPIPYRAEVLRNVAVAVVDEDRSQLSRQLVRMIDANEYAAVARRPGDFAAARKAYDWGEVHGIVVIPEGFQRDVLRGRPVGVAAYYDTSTFLHYRQLRTGVTQVVRTFAAGVEVKRLRAAGYSQERAVAARDPVEFVPVPLYNRSGGYATYVVPAVFVLVLQQTMLVGIGMIGGTRRERIRAGVEVAAEPGPVAAVLGKAGAYVSLYFLNALYYIAMLKLFYGYSFRAPALVLLVFLAPYLLATAFVGLTLSPLFHNREAAMCVYLFSSLPALFLSGFAWPREAMPEWLRAVSYAVPTTAGIDGFLRLSQMNARLRDVLFQWQALWALAGAGFVAAVLVRARVWKRNREWGIGNGEWGVGNRELKN